MGEHSAVAESGGPVTVPSLVEDFRELGIEPGDVLLVHSSLSSLGWVCGGPQAVVEALTTVLTESGTLVVPTHTSQYSDPSEWRNPPVPDEWVATIRETMPPFRPDVTPSRGVGAIPECFRDYPEVRRSDHPLVSFAAWGADADAVVADHALDYGLGEESPLARIYELGGDVLLLGVGHEVDTSIHLAEYRAEIQSDTTRESAPMAVDGERVVVEYEDVETSTDDFAELGADFERRVGVEAGAVGAADARLVDQRALVDFAVDWFEANR